MILMPFRYNELGKTLKGYQLTHSPLVSAENGNYFAAGFTDDKGMYYFVPKLAEMFNTNLDSAINIFFGFLLIFSAMVSILCFLFMFNSLIIRVVSVVGVLAITFSAYQCSDLYIAGYFVVASLVPVFILIEKKRNRFGKFLVLSLFFSGIVIGCGNFIRYNSGTGVLLFILVWLILNKQLLFKHKCFCLVILCFSALIPSLKINSILRQRDSFISANEEKSVRRPEKFPFWHLVYIGLGYFENNRGLKYSDSHGKNFVSSKDAKIEYLSEEYNLVLRNEMISIVKHDLLFFLKTIFWKMLILLKKVVKYLNYGLIFCFYIKPSLRSVLPFIIAVCFYMIPGVVVIPEDKYVIGMLTLVVIFNLYMIGIGLEKYWGTTRRDVLHSEYT